jgi:FkbM family methyltransferase
MRHCCDSGAARFSGINMETWLEFMRRYSPRARFARLQQLSHSGRATYLGNNRVLTKVVIGDFIFGFLAQADDRLIVPGLIVRGRYEPYLTDYFRRNIGPTDHCLDVGANFGYYTCLMARCADRGKTIGIEPDRGVFELLRDNIHINSLELSGSALQVAASDVVGQLRLYRRITRSGNTSIIPATPDYVEYMGEPAAEAFDVSCIPIDDLLSRFDKRIDFIKIDVEGAEPFVLRGAQGAIEANPQIKVVIEWSPGQIKAAGNDPGAFLKEIEKMGLRLSIIGRGGHLKRVNYAELGDYHPGILLARDTAVP